MYIHLTLLSALRWAVIRTPVDKCLEQFNELREAGICLLN